MAASYAAKYVDASTLTPSGSSVHISWKACVFDNRIVWELRRIAHSLGWSEMLCRLVKRHKAAWQTALSHFGLAYESEIVESHRSVAARGQRGAGTNQDGIDCAMVEYCVSTTAATVILLQCCMTRHKKQDREVALHVLALWFSTAIAGEAAAAMISEPPPADLCEQCEARIQGCGECSHMRSVVDAADMNSGGAPQTSLARHLVHCYSFAAGGCPALLGWLRNRVFAIADKFREHMDDIGQADPLKAMHPRAAKRRMRVDSDFKEAVVATVVQLKRSRTSSAWLRAQGEFTSNLAAPWTEKSLCASLSASWFAFREGQVFSVAGDCSRIGKPAEETYVAAIFCPDVQRAVWAVPQVLLDRKGHWQNARPPPGRKSTGRK